MKWEMRSADASRNVGDLWLEAARKGTIWVPYKIDAYEGAMLMMALNLLRDRDEITLHIDTANGYGNSFDACKELLWRRDNGLKTIGFVDGDACSIGLSYIAVCTYRVATPDSEFLVHGESSRQGEMLPDGTYLQDHYVANWLGSRGFTKRTYEEWLATVCEGELVPFGAEQALEWGVIDEIRRAL
jgi:hypothetical protein